MRILYRILLCFLGLLFIGLCLPEKLVIPVKDASAKDWNHNTFWYEPWGSSVVHKGIDIFADKNQDVIAATHGFVVYTGEFGNGGNAVAILGPKWRIHYYSHLNTIKVSQATYVQRGEVIGLVGNTGNALSKPAHLHYSILSLIPLPWLISDETQGWKKMFYLNPHDKLIAIDNN